MAGRICFAALDLALTDDTSALALMFPPMEEGELWRLVPFFWIPADNIKARVDKHQVPYDLWRDQGFLITTPGKVTDYDYITGEFLKLSKQFDVRELAYDPALANGLIKKVLQNGFKKDRIVKFSQTMMNYAAPCGDFVRAIARKEIQHDGDPVLRWQVTNLRWKKNHTGLIMPDKEKSIEKIDGPVAGIMAWGRGTHPDNAKLLKAKPKISTL
jgi:phage terminase large subunit-like protein